MLCLAAITAAALLRRTILRGPTPTFVLELPPYRMPMLGATLRTVWEKVRGFLVEAGTIILAFTIILWALLTFPNDPAREAYFEAERERVVATMSGAEAEEALAELDAEESARVLRESFAGRFAHAIEPALEPLGFDWRLGVGLVASFAAREVFVSTMGMVFSLGETDEEDASLRDELRAATWPDGRPLLTPLVGVSLMVFFVLAAQCMSTLAVVKREAGGAKWAVFLFTYMTTLAWIGSFLVTNVGRADLYVSRARLTGLHASSFTIVGNTCALSSLVPLSTCTVQVMCVPVTPGSLQANLTFDSDDPDTPTLNVPLQALASQY